MFDLKFGQKSGARLAAETLYAAALAQTRRSEFYVNYGVPDSFDGRFDLLLLHLYLLLNRLRGEAEHRDLPQALFDVTFRDMDQTLREMGIGDMGVPKHMRKMMKAFNGRMHAYDDALAKTDGQALHEALTRNLYGTLEKPRDSMILDMENYVRDSIKALAGQEIEALVQGEVHFALVAQDKKRTAL